MKLESKVTGFSFDWKTGDTHISLTTSGNQVANLEEYLGQNIVVEFKKAKRSLSTNGYLWVLLGELQKKLRIPKEELYRNYVHSCGAYEVVPIRNDAVKRFIDTWSNNGLGWLCDTTKSKLEGYTNVLAYYGTSAYTKEEMLVLLDQVVADCVEQGIPTKKKEEIESLLKEC